MTAYPDCDACKGTGKVYAYDRTGDGHGGMNGGEWAYFTCSACSDRAMYERWPDTIEITVCPGCGQSKPPDGYTRCPAGCSMQGHARKITVARATAFTRNEER